VPMNFVQVSGVIASKPQALTLPNFEGVWGLLSINPSARRSQFVDLVATDAVAQNLLSFRVGDSVLSRGHLTVAAKTGKLQVFVDSIESNEALARVDCTHRLQIPQVATAR
jgi:hypothetical protein